MAFKKGDVVWYHRRISDKNKYKVLSVRDVYLNVEHLPTGRLYVAETRSVVLVKRPVDKEFERIWV